MANDDTPMKSTDRPTEKQPAGVEPETAKPEGGSEQERKTAPAQPDNKEPARR